MNIGGVIDDHYRYKMPVPKIKVEGKGNGIKTVIINMTSMAKALKIPPTCKKKKKKKLKKNLFFRKRLDKIFWIYFRNTK